MTTEPELGPVGNNTPRQITPTDVAQFIRLDQCQRYLRLQLHRRNGGSRFMRDYGVVPQSIPPLLTRSGARFEHAVEEAVADHLWKINFVEDVAHAGNRADDNARVIQLARDLPPGETVVLFQPRLAIALGDWHLRGDLDILHLERDTSGVLHPLIADMKSSTAAKVEHRLQVAFYLEMLEALFTAAGIAHAAIEMGILYRGPAEDVTDSAVSPLPLATELEDQRRLAELYFGAPVGYLELVTDPESYRGAVRDLVTAPDSTAARVATAAFDALPYALGYKCDGCLFNEFCMKWTAERDDLSLLPSLTPEEKSALQRHGVTTMRELAGLKELRPDASGLWYRSELLPAPGKEGLVRALAATWPVGPRLDELVLRAKRYRQSKGDPERVSNTIPSKGYGSLPYTDAAHNPNLVRVYVDAQHDYLHDRVYLVGALVVACEHGQEVRRRSVVQLSDGPPDTPEREEALVLRWTEETMRAIVELAGPDEHGEANAPIHLIFWNTFAQRVLLDALARHFQRVLTATPLYDVITQLAGFDSPVATILDGEIRELRNYPMVCQSLQTVAAFLGFDWNAAVPYREVFRTRLFDFWRKFEWEHPTEVPWYLGRSRFNSQIPLEYAYAAWGELPDAPPGAHDDVASYRHVTQALLTGFHARRLEAFEHVARTFPGNKQTEKRAFHLPDLGTFSQKAQTLAQALHEFITIERHVELADWKAARLAPPERRVLAGITLIGRYCEEDQEPGVAAAQREHVRRWRLKAEYERQARAEGKATLTKEQKAAVRWSQQGTRIRLRLEASALDCQLDEMLALSSFRQGDRLVVLPRTDVDSRLPPDQQHPYTPTPKQMLWGTRATLAAIQVERDEAGRALRGWVELEMAGGGGASRPAGFAFGSIEKPFVAGELYTLDEDPNDWYGFFCARVAEGLIAGDANTLYDRLEVRETAPVPWPPAAVAAQQAFLHGLEALDAAGALHGFEPSKREYIGQHGGTPILLVQGPPGTGKSYCTAFALFARLQGAMAADRDFRVTLTCKTHAATDVLLRATAAVQERLRQVRQEHPDIFDRFFDARLLAVPLFRVDGREPPPAGVTPLARKSDRPPGVADTVDTIRSHRWCVLATAPAGTYRMLMDRFNGLAGHELCDCLILDEASQMNLPEAMMAALALKPDGQLIVVGDHRQMPPIVKHDWANEPRRTFREFRAYESLFRWLLDRDPPMIKFAESFRLHTDMAEFLRREIYVHDRIDFHSRQHRRLAPLEIADPFIAAVLAPEHTIVVIVHDEMRSTRQNALERALIAPILETLADPACYDLDPAHGLGVVVPHRAQRAALQEAVPQLAILDPVTGVPTRSAVDTVERFQGDERDAILVSATESDPQYLLLSSEFLLDPRRLTVALSRAKRKMVLVASRSVFSLFSADEETFANSQLWKNLLRHTCTQLLWDGERSDYRVEVWGNGPAPALDHVEAAELGARA